MIPTPDPAVNLTPHRAFVMIGPIVSWSRRKPAPPHSAPLRPGRRRSPMRSPPEDGIDGISTVTPDDLEMLQSIERRVLWLATYMIHYANKIRENPDGLKIGGHQASSSSVVSLATALYF